MTYDTDKRRAKPRRARARVVYVMAAAGPRKKPSPFKRSGLGRQDTATSVSVIDDLEYALDGMVSSTSSVRQSSALEVVRLCTNAKARTAAFRTHGVLHRVIASVVKAADPHMRDDPVYALALTGLLNMLAHDRLILEEEDLVQHLVPRVLRHLARCAHAARSPASASDSTPPAATESALDALWSSLRLLCPPQCVGAATPSPGPHDVARTGRRLSVLALLSCARVAPAACQAAREHEALHVLPSPRRRHRRRRPLLL